MDIKYVFCPITEDRIEDIECIETRDAVDGLFIEDTVPEEYKKKENWKNICRECKWHNF